MNPEPQKSVPADDAPKLFSEVAEALRAPGRFVRAIPYGSGHINDTFAVDFAVGSGVRRFIFQRINHQVFREPEKLMENMDRVLAHISAKRRTEAGAIRLELLRNATGAPYCRTSDGAYWRAFPFIAGARSHDVADSLSLAREAARAFGAFQRDLADLPPPRLHETIPHFHDTPRRFEALERAIAEDRLGRARAAQREIDFARARRPAAERLLALQRAGRLPERITHNDTKINNVLISDADGTAVCVIDLDTVMPGLVHYDFGDLVRTSTCAAPEDETQLDRVSMRFDYFEAILRGYLETAGDFLTPEERRHLPFGGILITLETGVRFLTDHLEGDRYFKIHRLNHNLDRARAQFRLVESIEAQLDRMNDLLERLSR